MPRCTPDRDGQRLCMAGQDCACGLQRGGTLLGRQEGWRWQCNPMSSCGVDATPADLPGTPPALPPGLEVQLPSAMAKSASPLRQTR
jgi:hypothetical protein